MLIWPFPAPYFVASLLPLPLAGVSFYIIQSCCSQTKISLFLSFSGKLIQFLTLNWASLGGLIQKIPWGLQIPSWLRPSLQICSLPSMTIYFIYLSSQCPLAQLVALADLELCLYQVSHELTETTRLCFLNTEIKGVYHHNRHTAGSLKHEVSLSPPSAL